MHQDKTYVVTGVASGIGAETAAELKRNGANVIGVDRNSTSENVDSFYQADLTDPHSIDALAGQLPPGVHGLANIAGLPPTAAPDLVLKVNLIGLRRLTEKLVPHMADGASIVNLASLAGFGWPNAVDQVKAALALDFDSDIAGFAAENQLDASGGRSYFLSKEAVVVWTMQNRWTWRDRGIRMNAVSPGPVDTPILGDFIQTLGARAEEDMKVMDRPGKPEDVAPVVSFMLSESSRWFRGANLTVDGGMSSHILCNIHQI
ncbi:MAG: coniferyl-alcohol dehydrogenase [Hyphomicrobiales bacterium]|nr:coniferyl-alcohol dehydrogenase [Hyphomicrobiales bacterium]